MVILLFLALIVLIHFFALGKLLIQSSYKDAGRVMFILVAWIGITYVVQQIVFWGMVELPGWVGMLSLSIWVVLTVGAVAASLKTAFNIVPVNE